MSSSFNHSHSLAHSLSVIYRESSQFSDDAKNNWIDLLL